MEKRVTAWKGREQSEPSGWHWTWRCPRELTVTYTMCVHIYSREIVGINVSCVSPVLSFLSSYFLAQATEKSQGSGRSVATSTPSTLILVTRGPSPLKEDFLGKMPDCRAVQRKNKMSCNIFFFFFLPESKEVLKECWEHVKRTQESIGRRFHWTNLGQFGQQNI